MPVDKSVLSSSENIIQYTLKNKDATLCMMVLNYGGTITHIITPDSAGNVKDVVLGFDDYKTYKHPENPYFGAIIGRFANRIGGGEFTVEDVTYSTALNNGENTLHGGVEGFDKRIWDVTVLSESPASIRLDLVSPDGDQQYPGTLTTSVTYTVTDENRLEITYHATTDKTTIVNLTNHTYFNLAGLDCNYTILDHQVSMSNDIKGTLAIDKNGLPTGESIGLEEAPWFDFTNELKGTPIGQRMSHLSATRGYDHPYVIHENYMTDTSTLPLLNVATIYSPETGIAMDFETTEPGFQFYTGGGIAHGVFTGTKYQHQSSIGTHSGFCLESQRPPDAVNKPQWRDSVLLKKGENYGSKTVFHFYVRSD
ncbi:aldose 1-epimerase [Spinellus fusiger]|nr:aldose 1-epimerase [Spinellus fusiger]